MKAHDRPPAPAFPAFRPTAGELIRHAAQRWGDRTLAVLGEERVSYADAEERSARLARGLLASGASKGTRVGLLAPNGPDWIIGMLAASRLGAIVTLLNTYHRERELSWILRHADVQVLLTVDRHLDHDYLTRLEAAVPGLEHQPVEGIVVTSHPYLRSVWTWGEGRRTWAGPVNDLDQRADAFPALVLAEVESEVSPADPMLVVYSSGSTADPKGAVHSQGAVVRHAHNLWQFRALREDDVIYTPMPLFWVGGLSYTLIAAIHAGATLVFEERFEPGATLDLIERERVTQVLGWPHMAKALTEHPSFPGRDLSSVRGGTVSVLVPTGDSERRVAIRANSLGMTETLGPHTIEDSGIELPPEKAGSFGRSVPGIEHLVADPVTGRALEPGEVGELWVRGYSLMLGLYKRERAEVFTTDGWYPTGDGGWFDDDGHLYFTGRLGDQIKSAGTNITPRDVELALEAHPEVAMSFVCGVPHPDRGEDVIAAVVLVAGTSVTGDELRGRLRDEIASYQVPRHIEVFTSRDQLPWLESGKADLRRIKALLADRTRSARSSTSQA
jgi:acyl-CoA synthetase (AMP-forming)/AMP-acid ligase II